MLLESVLVVLAQVDRPGQPGGGGDAGAGIAGLGAICCCFFVFLLIAAIPMIGQWKAFAKAGQPGWAALIPIYGIPIIFCKIAGKDDTRWLFYFIPIVNIVYYIQDMVDLCKAYGKETGFAIGMVFLPYIFWPILGFGSAQYIGPPSSSGGRPRYTD